MTTVNGRTPTPLSSADATCSETRAFAARLLEEAPLMAEGALEHLAGSIDALHADPKERRITRAALNATIELGLTMLSHGIHAESAEPPIADVVHAQYMARRGADIDELLHAYRLAHAYSWQYIATSLPTYVDRAAQARVVQETSSFTHALLDRISSQVSLELLAERKRRDHRTRTPHDRLLASIAAGELIDPVRASRMLGVTSDQPLICALCWGGRSPADVAAAGDALQGAAPPGSRSLLLVGDDEVVGWFPATLAAGRWPAAPHLREALAALAPLAHVALGDSACGVTGMHTSHNQARRAKRIVELTGAPPPTLTAFRDVALLDLLSRDVAAARDLVHAELGHLASRNERDGVLRRTVLTYLSHQSAQASTAANLHIHRNTLRQRLERAESRRGLPLAVRTHELQTALILAGALGDRVLADD